jgi:hypothetical protein
MNLTSNVSSARALPALRRGLGSLVAMAGLALALGAAPAAQAATLVSTQAGGGNIVSDFAAPGLVAFDLDLVAGHVPTVVEYTLDAADLAGPLEFNSVVRSFLGAGLPRLVVGFEGVSLASLGSVTRAFGGSTAATVGTGGAWVELLFTPAEFFDVQLGNPLAQALPVNWILNTTGLVVGDRIRISMTVPAPAGLPLVALALLTAGVALRRRGFSAERR